MESLDILIDQILPAAHDPGVDSTSNRNENQESSWGKGQPVRRTDKLTVVCEPIL
jgi:hypothetical protein